ncbi:hypothetical protein AO369_1462 [Moraxella catarrhalis]|nr:hypothetical protein AO369_1462 [Moraxella catarrhalis]
MEIITSASASAKGGVSKSLLPSIYISISKMKSKKKYF